MTNEQKMTFLFHVVALIFQSKAANTDITQVRIDPMWAPFIARGGAGRWFKGNLRGFDLDLRLGTQVKQLRILEQNPAKTDGFGNYSQYAVLAQQGHQVAWIIDRAAQTNAFLGRVQDGQFFKSEPRATYSRPMQAAAGAGKPAWAGATVMPDPNTLPEVPIDMGIPEYVITSLSDPEIDPSIMADLETDAIENAEVYDDFTGDPDMG